MATIPLGTSSGALFMLISKFTTKSQKCQLPSAFRVTRTFGAFWVKANSGIL